MASSDISYHKIIKPHIAIYIILALSTVFVFYNSLDHDFVYWDDIKYVVNNEAVKVFSLEHLRIAFSKIFIGNYAPIHFISYMLDYEFWGMSPAGFILTNLFIHFFNGILFYYLCLRLINNRFGAAIAAFIFLMHPVQVESVVWISQRKNVLSLFFFLVSLHCYISFRLSEKQVSWFYAISIITYILALLTKIAAVVLPLVLILYDLCYCRGRNLRLRIREYIPYVILSILLTGIAITTQKIAQDGAPVVYYAGTGYKTF
jgi:hypothetical protein